MWVGVHSGTSYTNFIFLASTKTNLECDMRLNYYERELVVNLLLISNWLGQFLAVFVGFAVMMFRYPELLFNPPAWKVWFVKLNVKSIKIIVVFVFFWLLFLIRDFCYLLAWLTMVGLCLLFICFSFLFSFEQMFDLFLELFTFIVFWGVERVFRLNRCHFSGRYLFLDHRATQFNCFCQYVTVILTS